ncbi:hypothetical protein [uncultured Paludibaculum sp.]|uniref:hypothetical protein n=1 Tax=uncultured Paludibaculum sp. TaxID=1765020 RepID=UPI002AAB4666|nr:hypothetical protein [uncultured Paludibaculum sp.]
MVAEIQEASLITYAKYSQATELLEQIRNDVEAVVAQRFVRAEQLESVVRRDASVEITATKRGSNALVPRPEVTAQLMAALNSVGVVQLVGDAGSGKTTLLAATSAEHGFTYISVAYLSPLEVAEVILRRLKPTPSSNLSYHVSLEGAHRELRSVCDGLSTFTLAIDGLDSALHATELIRAIGGTSSLKRIIYSIRYSELVNGHSQVSVPPFERREIEALLKEEERSFDSTTLDQLLNVSNGNPLLLRYCIDGGAGDYSQGLREFETAQWHSLPPRSKEVVSYIAISQAKLSLDDLLLLVGKQQVGPEDLGNELRNASWFLSEDEYGFSLRHDHQRETVLVVLNGSPQKRAYYARRVARVLQRRGDYVSAFYALQYAGDLESLSVARAAVFDLSRKGDFRRLRNILARMVQAGRQSSDREDLVTSLLALSEVEQNLGNATNAVDLLAEAERLVLDFSLVHLALRVKELKVWRQATTSWSEESIEAIYGLRDEYRSRGDFWSCGRITLEITVLLLRSDRLVDAEAECRNAEAAFREVGDNYGISLARRNLATALSATTGREEELERLLQEFRASQNTDRGKRERAWLCNVMVRRSRQAKRFPEAIEYAKEAIQIGIELGDGSVVAMNHLNLGNVYRDEEKLEEAVREYQDSSNRAKALGDLELEAMATRLSSAVYLEMGHRPLAIQYALYAAGLLRGTVITSQFINCLEQLGDSYDHQTQKSEAAASYVEAAVAAKRNNDVDECWRLGEAALELLANRQHVGHYLSAIDQLCEVDEKETRDTRSLIERLHWRLRPLLSTLNEWSVIGVLGLHFRLVFEGLPAPVAQFLFEDCAHQILSQSGTETWRKTFPLIPLLASLPEGALSLRDTAVLGSEIATSISSVHCKSRTDGAPHWVVGLGTHKPILCSITALDADVESALAIGVLVAFLKGFEQDIEDQIIRENAVLRREIQLFIGSHRSMPRDVAESLRIAEVKEPCVVTRAEDPHHEVPIFIILKAGVTRDWMPGKGAASSMQMVMGTALGELISAMFHHEIELEVLMPKVLKVIRRTIS